MVSTTLSLVVFFAVIACRFVFTGLRHRPLAREITAPQQQHTNAFEQGLHILDLARVGVIPDYRFENDSDSVHITPKGRAKRYLRRIVALIGATQMDDAYVPDVGKIQFRVGYRYVRRLRDMTDLECAYEQTCFYPAHKGMPKAEEIATALLQLKNNPALFAKWAAQSGACKADGQAFSPEQ